MKTPKSVGRPRIGDGAIVKSVSLDEFDWKKLNEWGNGNASKGVRRAIIKAVAWDSAVEETRKLVEPS